MGVLSTLAREPFALETQSTCPAYSLFLASRAQIHCIGMSGKIRSNNNSGIKEMSGRI